MLPLVGWRRVVSILMVVVAGAVRSQEGEDLALGYVKGDITDGGEIPKGLYQVLNLNHASLESLHNDTERYRFVSQGEP